jgi:hypothetical protein
MPLNLVTFLPNWCSRQLRIVVEHTISLEKNASGAPSSVEPTLRCHLGPVGIIG